MKHATTMDLPVLPVDDRLATGTVGAYVVTYRRPRLLVESLRAVLAQSHPLHQVVVVNNDPDTDIPALLAGEFPTVAVANVHRNAGSAGGFAAALRLAYDAGVTWAWLFDDDVLPYPDSLDELLAGYAEVDATDAPVGILAPLQESPRAVFGVSFWRHRLVPPAPQLLAASQPYPVDVTYWAGMLVHRRVIEEVGFPRSDFFRCFGDYEYCLRTGAAGLRIVAVPRSRVRHDPGNPTPVVRWGRRSVRLNWSPSRNYYHIRNAAYTTWFVLHDPLAAVLHVLRQLRLAGGDLLYEDAKFTRLRLRVLGLVDGFSGRLGHREDLER